uniref:RAP domain-containing protein n=1 Tax=Chromera velia CCMP2878 TaxID=1169474 RepID=A0A0G4I9F9_9ALVE|eukprot:Cvel_12128.t1-p1 / transcript=Cvel_12128.t1 / gene=Cvel_12128 / organism=Chromera_velia_CCMP2878 / gene_product=hypothetical protein / transcript_product=hypothetical protein / location=Cvel_scaffold781:39345-42704(-) / protein_length=1120 / sequence_SO=supercontig / SO=protein_coding / is_pseudo=false
METAYSIDSLHTLPPLLKRLSLEKKISNKTLCKAIYHTGKAFRKKEHSQSQGDPEPPVSSDVSHPLEKLIRLAAGRSTLSPRQLSNMCLAVAYFPWNDPDLRLRLLRPFLTACSHRLFELNPQDLSNALYAAALVGDGSNALVRALEDGETSRGGAEGQQCRHRKPRVLAEGGEFAPQGLSVLVWSLATLGARASSLFSLARETAVKSEFYGFSSQNLSNFAWAFANSNEGRGDSLLFFSIASAALALEGGGIGTFSAQEISILLWSFAATECVHAELFQAAGLIFAGRVGREFEPQHLSNAVWAYAATRTVPPSEFLLSAAEFACRSAEQFTAEGLSKTAWAFARTLDSDSNFEEDVGDKGDHPKQRRQSVNSPQAAVVAAARAGIPVLSSFSLRQLCRMIGAAATTLEWVGYETEGVNWREREIGGGESALRSFLSAASEEIRKRLQSQSPETPIGPVELTLLAWAGAKSGQDCGGLFGYLGEAVMQEVVCIERGLGEISGSSLLQNQLTVAQSGFSLRRISTLLWSFAMVGFYDEALFSCLCELTLVRVDEWRRLEFENREEGEKSRSFPSFSTMEDETADLGEEEREREEERKRGDFDEKRARETIQREGVTNRTVCLILWSLSTANHSATPVFSALLHLFETSSPERQGRKVRGGREACEEVQRSRGQSVALLSWACGVAGASHPLLFQQLAREVFDREREGEGEKIGVGGEEGREDVAVEDLDSSCFASEKRKSMFIQSDVKELKSKKGPGGKFLTTQELHMFLWGLPSSLGLLEGDRMDVGGRGPDFEETPILPFRERAEMVLDLLKVVLRREAREESGSSQSVGIPSPFLPSQMMRVHERGIPIRSSRHAMESLGGPKSISQSSCDNALLQIASFLLDIRELELSHNRREGFNRNDSVWFPFSLDRLAENEREVLSRMLEEQRKRGWQLEDSTSARQIAQLLRDSGLQFEAEVDVGVPGLAPADFVVWLLPPEVQAPIGSGGRRRASHIDCRPVGGYGSVCDGSEGRKAVVLEVDGPQHFFRNTESLTDTKRMRAPTGRSRLRRALLLRSGMPCVFLPADFIDSCRRAERGMELVKLLQQAIASHRGEETESGSRSLKTKRAVKPQNTFMHS